MPGYFVKTSKFEKQARNGLFNGKNKPNLHFVGKFKKHIPAGKLNIKAGRLMRKCNPKMCEFTQKLAQISFWSKLIQQKCHKIWKKSNLQNRTLHKTSPRNKQILIKTSPKTSNPQVLKKTQIHKKNKPKFVENRKATLVRQFLQPSLFAAVDTILGAIVMSHTHRNVTNQPKYGQIINCGLILERLRGSRSSTWNYVSARRRAFNSSVASFFVWLANRCACGHPRLFRFCRGASSSRVRVTLTRR